MLISKARVHKGVHLCRCNVSLCLHVDAQARDHNAARYGTHMQQIGGNEGYISIGIMEEASGRRHQGEGIKEEASLGRYRGGGIMEEA